MVVIQAARQYRATRQRLTACSAGDRPRGGIFVRSFVRSFVDARGRRCFQLGVGGALGIRLASMWITQVLGTGV